MRPQPVVAIASAALIGLVACSGGEGSQAQSPARMVTDLLGGLLGAEDEGSASETESDAPSLLSWLGDVAEAAPGGEKTVYYSFVDENGSMRFVESLEQVPASQRAKAGRIEMEANRPPPRQRAQAPARQPWAAAAAAPFERRGGREVIVYTAPWCGWCRKAMRWLDARQVPYDNRDIEANPAWRDELVSKTGRTSIPVVEIDGELIRGYSEEAMERLL
ncbi:MAG: glutaredoxin family protein [Myxococcota bacterium]|nr:glutaredoxin family protein [Myxococcota bacterium]